MQQMARMFAVVIANMVAVPTAAALQEVLKLVKKLSEQCKKESSNEK